MRQGGSTNTNTIAYLRLEVCDCPVWFAKRQLAGKEQPQAHWFRHNNTNTIAYLRLGVCDCPVWFAKRQLAGKEQPQAHWFRHNKALLQAYRHISECFTRALPWPAPPHCDACLRFWRRLW